MIVQIVLRGEDEIWWSCGNRQRRITISQATRILCAGIRRGGDTDMSIRDRKTGLTVETHRV